MTKTITRRQFITRSAGTVAVGLFMPKLLLGQTGPGSRSPKDSSRKIFVVIQLAGGNDGLNTVIPYTDSNYAAQRPNLAFKEPDLKDSSGNSTIISDQLGLHPSLSELKSLYDAGRVAVVLGVGYPDPNLSHFFSMDVWHTADPTGLAGEGWLGRYADVALINQTGLTSAAVASGALPKSLLSPKVVVPSILSFQFYDFLTDPAHPEDNQNQLNTYQANAARNLAAGSLVASINHIGSDAVSNALQLKDSISHYSSSVVYPSDNPLAQGLQMVAEIVTTAPDANLLYVSLGGFDHHSNEIDHSGATPNKLAGQHAQLLGWFSQAVKLFYDDMAAHSLADDVVLLQWSEFGRRVNENDSFGTDHGTAAPMFLIGNPIHGGLYGSQPSLASSDLDEAGNMKFNVDFRSVYATVADHWLGVDSGSILGGSFDDVGLFG
ncbi:MAG TPA: DUF1501 domain-containing protein [Blastocatellia bacterium]|nr:DUF1501 domain-containing protein [Blastocatellia bacterium]